MTRQETLPAAGRVGGSEDDAGGSSPAARGPAGSPGAQQAPVTQAAVATSSLFIAPICRRRALLMIGGSVAAATALPTVLAACSMGPAPTAWVTAEARPADLEVNQPVEVPFAGTTEAGDDLIGVAWLVAQADGSVVAFDPRCTHQACEYDWADGANRFECACHEAAFAVDGAVLYGPPPRPLARFETRTSGETIELAVPEDYKAPLPGD